MVNFNKRNQKLALVALRTNMYIVQRIKELKNLKNFKNAIKVCTFWHFDGFLCFTVLRNNHITTVPDSKFSVFFKLA